jgi:hypothetical protein
LPQAAGIWSRADAPLASIALSSIACVTPFLVLFCVAYAALVSGQLKNTRDK